MTSHHHAAGVSERRGARHSHDRALLARYPPSRYQATGRRLSAAAAAAALTAAVDSETEGQKRRRGTRRAVVGAVPRVASSINKPSQKSFVVKRNKTKRECMHARPFFCLHFSAQLGSAILEKIGTTTNDDDVVSDDSRKSGDETAGFDTHIHKKCLSTFACNAFST